MARTNLGSGTIKARKERMLTNGRNTIRNTAQNKAVKNIDLADRCNVSAETISRWWKAPERIGFGNLADMAIALGLEVRIIDPGREMVVQRDGQV